jgi:hypothetical protein
LKNQLGIATQIFMTIGDLASFALPISISRASAKDHGLSKDQLDAVTAGGGQITSIGPAKAEAAKAALPKRGVKRRGGQIASI